ncbi:DUF2642 domain-containing protein [Ureibacillus sp. GCM10028918]|uniref:DUF2642 domain-containing protein n=1 Tax=Ureibacillus sp. GCM10028918 TaxID=3273429 RepID=UPI00361C6950
MMKDLRQSIGGLKGAVVRLFFSDNQFIEGTLIAVKVDHLVVEANEKVFYIALKQLYGISKNAKDNRVSRQNPPFIDKNRLTDVLNSMKYNIITINGMYNKLLVGLLISISEDCIMLVNRDELHFINYSSIFNVYDGIYEQEKIQSDSTLELRSKVKQNTEQLIETPAILIPLTLEPVQDKIAESSFLEKNPSPSHENIHDENWLEIKATELSITENPVTKSDGNSPMSSQKRSVVETEPDKQQEKVFLESKDSSQSKVKEVVLSSQADQLIMSSNDVNLKPLTVHNVENEIVNENQLISKSDYVTKETKEELIQQPPNEEIDDQLVIQESINEKLQPLCNVEDNFIDMELKEGIEEVTIEEKEILSDKIVIVTNVKQEDLLAHESINNQALLNEKELNKHLDPHFNQMNHNGLEEGLHNLMNKDSEAVPKSYLGGTSMKKKFYLIEPLSKHKIKQSHELKNIPFETETHSNCPTQDERILENLMAIPCQTPPLEMKVKSDTLQMENHKSSLDEKVLFEAQYFALMKHAERMMDSIDSSQNGIKNISPEGKVMIKNQYLSLFKSAKKMYIQLNEERNKRFVRM